MASGLNGISGSKDFSYNEISSEQKKKLEEAKDRVDRLRKDLYALQTAPQGQWEKCIKQISASLFEVQNKTESLANVLISPQAGVEASSKVPKMPEKLLTHFVESVKGWITDVNTSRKEYFAWLEETGEMKKMDGGGGNEYICFTGALYIGFLIASTIKQIDPSIDISFVENELKTSGQELLVNLEAFDLDGLYHCQLSNSFEDHGFVIYVSSREVTVLNSYGGVDRFYTVTHSKEDFKKMLLTSPISAHDYAKIWGLPEEAIKNVFAIWGQEWPYGLNGKEEFRINWMKATPLIEIAKS